MLINGEKYACEACVRGHRVSNCQHHDRNLQHINKKGRPVTQCHHCRAMRKSRSAHVKCDCGEKTSKCAHLQPTLEGHRDTCCCNHGGRCTCALKKEPQLDTVPEDDSDGEASPSSSRSKIPARRRRANTTHSEGGLIFDEHGHHKPAHKHNKTSRKCSPYTLNRVNSAHSSSSLSTRSVDNLHSKAEPRKRGAGACTSSPSEELRQARSEAASPLMSGSSSFQHLNGQLPPLDLSGIEYPPYPTNGGFDLFSNLSEHDQPMFSAGLSNASVDWSHYDGLDFHGADGFAPSSYGQTTSFNGFEFAGSEQPGLTSTSASGEGSETDEFIPANADGAFRNSTDSGFFGLSSAQTDILGNAEVGSINYDEFFKANAANKYFPAPSSLDEPLGGTMSLVDEDPVFWMGNYQCDGVPTMTESSDQNVPAFWDPQ